MKILNYSRYPKPLGRSLFGNPKDRAAAKELLTDASF